MFESKRKKEQLSFYFLVSLVIVLALAAIALILNWNNRPVTEVAIENDNSASEIQQSSLSENKTQFVQKKFIQPVAAEKEPTASFSDIFSSAAWFNEDETTLLRNDSAMTLTFEPKIKIEEAHGCPDSFIKNNNCLGKNCLSIKDNQIFYNQKLVNLPANYQEILNLASQPVVDKWLIAGVVKQGDSYRPLLWWFDGQDFLAISLPLVNNQPPTIRYLGNFGLGSSGRSVLVLYSAEDGLAWQINGEEVRDISYLFPARVNNGGFKPGIIAFGQDQKTIWYVYDAAGERLRWLKLWQNNTNWIEGIISLASFLPTGTKQALMSIKPDNQPQISIAAYNEKKQCQLYTAIDYGFVQEKRQVTSVSLTSYDKNKLPIVKAKINNVLGGWSGFENNWQLSFDNKKWQTVEIGQKLDDFGQSGDLWWRWQIGPSNNPYNSPCLKMVNLVFWQ